MQVIQEHAAKFLNEMNSEEIASQLKVLNLIPESVEHCIQHSTCREDANGHLLTYLKKDATEEQVRGVFTIASQNYGRMSEFAANLLQKLLKGLYRHVYTYYHTTHILSPPSFTLSGPCQRWTPQLGRHFSHCH